MSRPDDQVANRVTEPNPLVALLDVMVAQLSGSNVSSRACCSSSGRPGRQPPRMRLEDRRQPPGGRLPALIRSAVDVAYPDDDVEARREAGDRLLALEPMLLEVDRQELKRRERASLLGER